MGGDSWKVPKERSMVEIAFGVPRKTPEAAKLAFTMEGEITLLLIATNE